MTNQSASEDDSNALRALTQLKSCWSAVDELKHHIRAMLDDVTLAFDENERDIAVLSAWNDWQIRVQEQQSFVQALIDETQDFMDTHEFEALDSSKKADYWDTLHSVLTMKIWLDAQYIFFQLLSNIEHTEQTVKTLSQILTLHCNTLLYRQVNDTLVHRGLSLHQQRIMELRNRLLRETNLLLWLIEQAIKNPYFLEMQPWKQYEYHNAWKTYSTRRVDIDMD